MVFFWIFWIFLNFLKILLKFFLNFFLNFIYWKSYPFHHSRGWLSKSPCSSGERPKSNGPGPSVRSGGVCDGGATGIGGPLCPLANPLKGRAQMLSVSRMFWCSWSKTGFSVCCRPVSIRSVNVSTLSNFFVKEFHRKLNEMRSVQTRNFHNFTFWKFRNFSLKAGHICFHWKRQIFGAEINFKNLKI